jgi:hypothetical protein
MRQGGHQKSHLVVDANKQFMKVSYYANKQFMNVSYYIILLQYLNCCNQLKKSPTNPNLIYVFNPYLACLNVT